MLTISSIGVMPWPQQSPSTKAQAVTATKASNAVSPENARGGSSVASAGDAAQVQASYAPSALPPVDPAAEALKAVVYSNAQVPERSGVVEASRQNAVSTQPKAGASVDFDPVAESQEARPDREANATEAVQAKEQADQAERAQNSQRFKGELPVEYKSPVQEAMDTQINELLPNMWAASRAAVDVLIGEEARAAAAARAADVAEKLVSQPAASDKAVEAADTYTATQAGSTGNRTPGQVVNTKA